MPMPCCCCQEDYDDVHISGVTSERRSRKSAQGDAAVKQSMRRGDNDSASNHEEDVHAVATWRQRSAAEKAANKNGSTGEINEPLSPPQRAELSAAGFKLWQEQQKQNKANGEQSGLSVDNNIESIEVDELSTVNRVGGAVDLDDDSAMIAEGEELDAIVLALNEKDRSRSESEDYDITLSPDKTKSRKSPNTSAYASPSQSPRQITPSRRDSPARRTHDSGESQPSARRSPKPMNLSQSFPDSLSDVPSNIDSETKERYLMACRLLKSALIEKETVLMPTEKSFLQGLLDAPDDDPSEAHASAIESASHTLLSDPLFQFGSSAMDALTTSADSVKAAWYLKIEKERANNLQMNQSSLISETTPPTQNRTPERKKARTVDRETNMSPERVPPSPNPTDYPFRILGIQNVRPGVLTPPLMEAMRGFFPYAIAEENFWLKFSLEAHGASLPSLLSKVRTSRHTILSIETKDGHVFGAFCSSPWRVRPGWFGSGEAFLWRLKNSRIVPGTKTRNYDYDNEMEVYPYTGSNELVQYCTKRAVAVGGGDYKDGEDSCPYVGEPTGIGLMIDADLLGGETNSSSTFANPRLSGRSSKSNEFDIVNLEVWTVTPCISEPEAELLEMRRLFVEENIVKS
jgi:hypothetical protein